jgi:hypothetical protein
LFASDMRAPFVSVSKATSGADALCAPLAAPINGVT